MRYTANAIESLIFSFFLRFALRPLHFSVHGKHTS